MISTMLSDIVLSMRIRQRNEFMQDGRKDYSKFIAISISSGLMRLTHPILAILPLNLQDLKTPRSCPLLCGQDTSQSPIQTAHHKPSWIANRRKPGDFTRVHNTGVLDDAGS